MTPRGAARAALATLLLVGLTWAATHRELFSEDSLRGLLDSAGPWAPAVFVGVYALAAALFVPASALTVAGGALFGPVAGTAWSLLGATIGATISFLLARYVFGDAVRDRGGKTVEAVLQGVEAEGWRFVAVVRLLPIFPFNLSNYALGVTRIGLAPYVLTSALCMAPACAALAWAGHGGRAALGGDLAAVGWVISGFGVVGGLALVARALRSRRSAGLAAADTSG